MISNYETNKKSLIGVVSIFTFLLLFSIFGSSIFLKFQGVDKIDINTIFLTRFVFWISILFVWLYANNIEKQDLFIWKSRKYNFIHYFIHIILVFIAVIFAMYIENHLLHYLGSTENSQNLGDFKSIIKDSKLIVLFVIVTAGVTEETIFRGYIQPRLESLMKSPFLSIFITSLLFAILHIGYGTFTNVIGPFLIGLIFSIYYWKFRNIKVLIICHILTDLLAFSTLLIDN